MTISLRPLLFPTWPVPKAAKSQYGRPTACADALGESLDSLIEDISTMPSSESLECWYPGVFCFNVLYRLLASTGYTDLIYVLVISLVVQ
jgi:hypothetical protein